jgi:hypothetical protein
MILITIHQFAFAIVSISDGAKAVMFQFEDVVRTIKGFCNAPESHWFDLGGATNENLVAGQYHSD